MKNYLFRIGFFIPIVLFAVYLLIGMIGCLANAVGINSLVFCQFFSEGAAIIFAAAVALTLYCQGRACFGKKLPV